MCVCVCHCARVLTFVYFVFILFSVELCRAPFWPGGVIGQGLSPANKSDDIAWYEFSPPSNARLHLSPTNYLFVMVYCSHILHVDPPSFASIFPVRTVFQVQLQFSSMRANALQPFACQPRKRPMYLHFLSVSVAHRKRTRTQQTQTALFARGTVVPTHLRPVRT